METENLITLEKVCELYEVEPDFIVALNDFGLLDFIVVEEIKFVNKEQIGDLERMMRLHYDLEINMAGIDAISHLLQRVHEMQRELISLKNRLG